MRSYFLSSGSLKRMFALLALAGAGLLVSAMPAAADDAPNAPNAPNAPTEGAKPEETKPAVLVPPPATEGKDGAAQPSGDKPSHSASPAKKRRGGIHPCMTPDPGWGIYDKWSNEPTIGQMIAPHRGGITKTGGFDLIVHFHGHEPIRKEFVKVAKGSVLVGIDLGIGSGVYASTFAAPNAFPQLVASVEAAMAKKTGNAKAHVRKLTLSSWSAGYGAIEQILRQPASAKRVNAVVLLDSLHTGYVDERAKSLKTGQIDVFVDFARRAAKKQAFMFMSHSSILPPGYASTTEVASYVIGELKGKPKKAKRADVLGLDLIRRFDKGDFHVRGYTGEDKPDHCAHIGLMADIVRVHLEPRWKTPRGKL